MQQDGIWSDHGIAFDALTEFVGYGELEATTYIFDYFGHLTTGVAMMNPGWRQVGSGLEHELYRDPSVGLADLLIKERMFTFFLYSGCVPLTGKS